MNLFTPLPDDLSQEVLQTLASSSCVRIERIVSHGHSSPPGFWYDQSENEWVVLLSGEAKLLIEGRSELLHMRPGDYVLIEAHVRHRVDWTTSAEPSIWLAIFFC